MTGSIKLAFSKFYCDQENVQSLRNALFDKILTPPPPLVTQRNGLPYPLPSVT